MIDEMQLRNFSPKTIEMYVDNVARFARYFNKSPDKLGPEEVRTYLLQLIQEKQRSWGTYKVALAALRYFYRWVIHGPEIVEDIRCPRPERRLPVVLSFDEVRRFFAAIPSFKHRMILMTAYAAGLRISEVVNLQVRDIDSQRMVIRVCQGKRKKDRYTILSPVLLQMLRHWWVAARPVSYLYPGRSLNSPMSVATVQKMCKEALGHASPKTTALYTHVSAKLIAQTKSPLDLLHQEGHAPKVLPASAQKDNKVQAEKPQKVAKRPSAKPERPRQGLSTSPKKARQPRRDSTKKGRKPR
jgi:site-specific recombinase XerD